MPYIGPWYDGGSTKAGKIGGTNGGTDAGAAIIMSPFFGFMVPVLLMPWLFAVAGLGFKYVATSS